MLAISFKRIRRERLTLDPDHQSSGSVDVGEVHAKANLCLGAYAEHELRQRLVAAQHIDGSRGLASTIGGPGGVFGEQRQQGAFVRRNDGIEEASDELAMLSFIYFEAWTIG